MRSLRPAQVVIELVQVLWSAKRYSIAWRKWQISRHSHIGSCSEERCCGVIAGKVQRWANRSGTEWLIVVQAAVNCFELVHHCRTEYVSYVAEYVLVIVTESGVISLIRT